jgi:hypothetical protein
VSVRPSTGIPRSKPARAISLQRRAAFYIDRPLKRAMAADLPVEPRLGHRSDQAIYR